MIKTELTHPISFFQYWNKRKEFFESRNINKEVAHEIWCTAIDSVELALKMSGHIKP